MVSGGLHVESALGQARQDVLSHAGQKHKGGELTENFHRKALQLRRRYQK